jgi:hypothetical integral membrane protein (TIGR02206 family)
MQPFESYGWEHFIPLMILVVVVWQTIKIGNRVSASRSKILIGIMISLVTWGIMFTGDLIKLFDGSYTYREDLPLYLCRLVAWMFPVVLYARSRKWIGIFYFWILAGTLQALLTPDLAEGFPDFWYFRYWILHCGLVAGILYTIIVFKIRIGWRDLVNAIIATQVYLIVVHGLNLIFRSNYSYTLHKPPGDSILDIMGPWPVYLVTGEVVMIILFLCLILPFKIGKPRIDPEINLLLDEQVIHSGNP